MSKFYNYDTRGASEATQIINLERMVQERDLEIERLRSQLAIAKTTQDNLYEEIEHLFGSSIRGLLCARQNTGGQG